MPKRKKIEDIKTDLKKNPTMPLSDVAILLGIGRAAAYKAYHSGEIECVRVGRRILVITAALRKKLGVNDE